MTNTGQGNEAKRNDHTPTPWKVEGPFLERSIFGEKDLVTRLVGFDKIQSANAAFIVRAVNSHDALIKALKDALEVIGSWGPDGSPEWAQSAEAVIAQAEGL